MENTPYSFRIDAEFETIFFTFTGFINPYTFMEASDALIADPRWRNDYDCLCDLRQTEEVDVTPKGMNAIVQWMTDRMETLNVQGKTAVLIDRWTLTLLCRLVEFRLKSKYPTLKVFYREKKALRWLGLPEDTEIQAKLGGNRRRDVGGGAVT